MKHYTWEEKIDSLVALAKAAGRYTNTATETGTDYYKEARQQLFDAYEEFCEWRHEEPYVVDEIKQLIAQKDQAYWERNQLVAALSKIYPAWLSRHEESDTAWEMDWRWIVFIEIPTRWAYGDQRNIIPEKLQYETKQVSWHIHDNELQYFRHLEERPNTWDGHTSEEKYSRLRNIESKK